MEEAGPVTVIDLCRVRAARAWATSAGATSYAVARSRQLRQRDLAGQPPSLGFARFFLVTTALFATGVAPQFLQPAGVT
ncbi:hypothetical protein GCM10023335_54350 [Streptomyces siamensis]|uniref:Uncharacterized protein n=1 Tax=Streptomyces siamensis TaxID=1274986 RepID=A0ABP9J6R3_9ACTN